MQKMDTQLWAEVLCSLHFVGGNGPSEEHPDPIKSGTKIVRSRKRPEERRPYQSPKKQHMNEAVDCLLASNEHTEEHDRNEAAEALLELNEQYPSTSHECREMSEVSAKMGSSSIPTHLVQRTTKDIADSGTVQSLNKETQTTFSSEENMKLRIENRILKNSQTVSSSFTSLIKKPTKKAMTSKTNKEKDSTISISNNLHLDEKSFKFYTGLTLVQFTCLWNFLGNCSNKIIYWNTKVADLNQTPKKRRGPKRSISPQSQLIMTLMRLRLGLLHQDLAYRFETNVRQVSIFVMTWVQLLFKQFSTIRKEMFASRLKIRKHLPKTFKKYKDIRCIIDCTEVHVQSPSNFQAQGNQYSSYKGYTSNKFLVAIAPNGAILYVSDAFEGSISDKEIVLKSGFLDYLEPGDVIMADRGFLINDILNERQVKMIRPPFLGARPKFTPQEEALTKDIAKHRIHVERAIERMKKFKILQNILPQSLQPVFSQMVFVIACLVNFQLPLVK